MVIVTTLYNAEQYIERCIGSLMGQDFVDFKCYITDDMSTDNSVNIVKKTIENDDRFILIENQTKFFQSGNYDQIIRNNPDISDDEPIIELDGDDWLPDSKTLTRMNEIYQDKDIWITNGSFVYSDGRKGFSKKQENIDKIRQVDFTASHMRTWRAFLWRKIKVEDLKDENGLYWKVAGDLAFLYPMLEMSGDKHYKFIDTINYVYNEENPINDHKIYQPIVQLTCDKIRKKQKYGIL